MLGNIYNDAKFGCVINEIDVTLSIVIDNIAT